MSEYNHLVGLQNVSGGHKQRLFITCRVVGKQISESGFDHMFIRCGIYGPTTMGQIIDGKHMQRCLTAYMILYLALHEVMLNNIFEDDQLTRDQVNAAITTFSTKVTSIEDLMMFIQYPCN